MGQIDGGWTLEKQNFTPLFMGIDCSSRAIHAVLVDEQEKVIGQGKWRSSEDDFNVRFLIKSYWRFLGNFIRDFQKIAA